MKRVIVADDTEDIRMLLRIVLGSAEFDVIAEAKDGDEALAAWERHREEGVFAVILDHRMPHRTGLEVARLVLADAPSQRVILFSANVDDGLRRDAADVGVSALVEKTHLLSLASHPALAA